MNREEMIDAIVKAYMESIMCVNLEDWIENVLRHGRMDKGLENMTDEQVEYQYNNWVAWSEETTEEDE